MSLAVLCATPTVAAELTRDKVPVEETWNLADLYPDDAAWKKAKEASARRIPDLKKMEATSGRSAADLLRTLNAIDDTEKELERVAIYAYLQSDQDTRNAQTLALKQELDVVFTDFSAATAWLRPAVLKLGRAKIDAFLKQEKGLAIYKQPLDDILRRAPHTLSPGEEKILADSSLIAGSAENIYTILSNADIKFPTIRLSTGKKVELTQAAYTKHRESTNRADRILVFKTFWQVFKDYSRTLGVSLDANVKRDLFYARARRYDNSLESALDDNNIPVAVYKNLIADIHKNLPTLHRYLRLRAKLLGIDKLAYHDLYPPLVKAIELKYSYAEGKELVQEALAPLGPEYQQALATALNSRWIDVHPTKGKKSGAYSSGDAYDVHPYILLNYNGGYDDVSTIAHEIGHTMHSFFSNKNQPYATSDYPIFLAEVASTTNEALLIRHVLKKEKDPKVRLYLLGSYLESLRTTIFRQTMFAEFELMIHEAAERGEALNNESLAQMYGKLLREYHGHDLGVCQIDDLYTYEWAYIPHFYYNFYVFQYATGMVAATALSQRVLNGGQPELAAYLGFLKAGSSRYAIDILKSAGVDLTTSAPFDSTMKVMNEIMDEIEAIEKTTPPAKGKGKGGKAK
ncbi:MAG: oligoendopeptidase F [Deltaproteobacteria bacterium]|nr:oligoendopeptidase F [Deltaproteobacteria bacterium]